MNANSNLEDEQVFQVQTDEYMYLSKAEAPADTEDKHKQQLKYQSQLLPRFTFKKPERQTRNKPFPVKPQIQQQPFSTSSQLNSEHFSKNFESGNLMSVKELSDGTYKLKIAMDCNSNKQSQWFYFSCQGLKRGRFRIAGFVKPTSLYSQGMRICVNENDGAWVRGGENITYGKDEDEAGYCLNFTYKFKNPNNKTLFAYCFPYTYTDLKNLLEDLQKRKLPYLSTKPLTISLLDNPIPLLTISSSPSPKPIIVLTARVHPGQSVSSHVMQGFLESLLSTSKIAQLLRDHYTFKIIPMVNPDGVVMGNYRLSYSGCDLNRKWRDTSRRLHKEIYEIKKSILAWNRESKVRMTVDMHGHSRQKGVFFYGCESPGQSNNVREFPYMMSSVHPSYCYQNCNFSVHKSKQGTQRIAMHNLLRLPYVYTLETSFCGDVGTECNYSISDLNIIGSKLVQGMFLYLAKDMTIKMRMNSLSEMEECLSRRSALISKMYQNRNILEVGAQVDSGSDSAPSEGCFSQQQLTKILKLDQQNNKTQESAPKTKIRKRLLTTATEDISRLNRKRVSQNPHLRIVECKMRIINGSIFNKEIFNRSFGRETSPHFNAQRFFSVKLAGDTSPRKGIQFKRPKFYNDKLYNYQRLKTTQDICSYQRQDSPKPLRLEQAASHIDTAPLYFYPSRKLNNKSVKRCETLCLVGVNTMKESNRYPTKPLSINRALLLRQIALDFL